jgi:short-subunit dehydrogenase
LSHSTIRHLGEALPPAQHDPQQMLNEPDRVALVQGQRVLVTGASSGIGAELARQIAARGAHLAVAARREAALESLAAEIAATGAPRPVVLPADLSRPGAAAELAARAVAQLGHVDVLVNNAAASLHGLQWTAGAGPAARELFEVNLWSPLALIEALVPHMRERGSGTVANVTSMIQVAPFPALGHTCASKAALAIATQTLRMELRRTRIHVLEAPLGVIDTPGSRANRDLPGAASWLDSGPKGTAQGAARAIVRGIERRRRRVIYPRWVAPGYALPGIARAFAQRYGRAADPDLARVGIPPAAG